MNIKPVKKISIDKIISYITCPMKLGYTEKEKKFSVQELYDIAGRESIKTLFSLLAIKKSWTRAYSEAMEKFNFIWINNIDKLNEPFNKQISFSQNYLLSKAKSIVDFSNDEIVAVNFPLEYAVSKSMILTDSIDLVVINGTYKHSRKHYRAIDFSTRLPFDNDRYVQMKAGFFRLAMQSYLTKSQYRDFSYEVRPLNGKDEIFTCNPHYLPTIQTIIKNVSKAIENKLWYATNNEEACKVCPYRHTCSLSMVTKL